MDEILTRFIDNLFGRIDGPMNFRLILQPLMAISFAFRDGRKDSREGRVPYFWALLTERGHRRKLLRTGWKSVGKIFVIAFTLDAIYQLIVVRWFYFGESLLTATIMAIVPYVLLRGLFSRLQSARNRMKRLHREVPTRFR